jgi:hypothetical protein
MVEQINSVSSAPNLSQLKSKNITPFRLSAAQRDIPYVH